MTFKKQLDMFIDNIFNIYSILISTKLLQVKCNCFKMFDCITKEWNYKTNG